MELTYPNATNNQHFWQASLQQDSNVHFLLKILDMSISQMRREEPLMQLRIHRSYHIAESYEAWINERCGATADEVFRMVLNYITVMNLYRMFQVAV